MKRLSALSLTLAAGMMTFQAGHDDNDRPRNPRPRPPSLRTTKVKFTDEELAEIRRLPKRERARAVKALQEKYRKA